MPIDVLPLLDWTKLEGWRDQVLLSAIETFAPRRDVAWLRGLPSPSDYWDDYKRIEPLRLEAGIESREHFLLALGELLSQQFARLRSIHLCRPVDFNSYRRHGLQKMDPKQLQDDLKQFFSVEHPNITPADIQQAIDSASTKTRAGEVYFGIDEHEMLDTCGHYACYGSEYQVTIAVRIVGDGQSDYRQTLKRRGRPAFVEAHLPISIIDSQTVDELADDVLQAALWSLQLGKDISPKTGFGFSLSDNIVPEMIHDVKHAPQAKDPFARH